MIIYLSNRNVNKQTPNSKLEKLFGNDFNPNADDELRMCVSEKDANGNWPFTLVDKGKENQRLGGIRKRIINNKLHRNWLLFLHGNNQAFEDNVKKCQRLHDQYGMNVIAFSWPSQPSVSKKEMAEAARELSFDAWIVRALTAPIPVLGKKLYRKLSQYLKAEINSKRSSRAFNKVLGLVENRIRGDFSADELNLNFLSYSLGNRVLMHTADDDLLDNGDDLFSNHIMCQADVDHDKHDLWVDEMNYSKRLYITHNEYDLVLGVSDIQNHDRLGNTTDDLPIGLPCRYVDFSEGEHVAGTHAMFFLDENGNDKKQDNGSIKYDNSTTVRKFFNNVFLGKNVFPTRKPEKSTGFKYNKKYNTYSMLKTEPYLEPTED